MISEEPRGNNWTNKQKGKKEQNGAKWSSVTTEVKRGGPDLRVSKRYTETGEADKHLHTIYKTALNGNLVIARNTPNHNSIFKFLTFVLSMGYLRQLGRIEVQQTGQNNYKNKILN